MRAWRIDRRHVGAFDRTLWRWLGRSLDHSRSSLHRSGLAMGHSRLGMHWLAGRHRSFSHRRLPDSFDRCRLGRRLSIGLAARSGLALRVDRLGRLCGCFRRFGLGRRTGIHRLGGSRRQALRRDGLHHRRLGFDRRNRLSLDRRWHRSRDSRRSSDHRRRNHGWSRRRSHDRSHHRRFHLGGGGDSRFSRSLGGRFFLDRFNHFGRRRFWNSHRGRRLDRLGLRSHRWRLNFGRSWFFSDDSRSFSGNRNHRGSGTSRSFSGGAYDPNLPTRRL